MDFVKGPDILDHAIPLVLDELVTLTDAIPDVEVLDVPDVMLPLASLLATQDTVASLLIDLANIPMAGPIAPSDLPRRSQRQSVPPFCCRILLLLNRLMVLVCAPSFII